MSLADRFNTEMELPESLKSFLHQGLTATELASAARYFQTTGSKSRSTADKTFKNPFDRLYDRVTTLSNLSNKSASADDKKALKDEYLPHLKAIGILSRHYSKITEYWKNLTEQKYKKSSNRYQILSASAEASDREKAESNWRSIEYDLFEKLPEQLDLSDLDELLRQKEQEEGEEMNSDALSEDEKVKYLIGISDKSVKQFLTKRNIIYPHLIKQLDQIELGMQPLIKSQHTEKGVGGVDKEDDHSSIATFEESE